MTGVRWKPRFNNYCRAFKTLAAAVELAQSRKLSDLGEQGLIHSFEFTHELAWKVLKDYLEEKGFVGLIGSRDATRTAFGNGLIEDGEAWMQMIADRNRTSHTYDEEVAHSVAENILTSTHGAFVALAAKFTTLGDDEPCNMG